MNAHVIRIQGSAWRPRKGGSVKLVIEVRPGTQTEWVEALEMFKQRPELSVTVVAPKVDPLPKWKTHRGVERHRYEPPVYSAGEYEPNESEAMKETVAAIKQGYDAIGPKADVDCPEPKCFRGFGHDGEHNIPPPCPELGCQLAVGHLGEHAILIRPCPEPKCDLSFGHSGLHHLFPSDCPKPDCNLLAGHKGKCVKKKVAK